MKQARINCPHCGAQITVRQSESAPADISPEKEAKIWDAADKMFKAMDENFRKIFHPSLWRK